MLLVALFPLVSCVLGESVVKESDSSGQIYTPTGWANGSEPQLNNLTQYSTETLITLTQDGPVITFDYGIEVQGRPTFQISSLTGLATVELIFTEAFNGLNNASGDGPFPFSNGLSSTYRTERFNITDNGSYESALSQGGLRWQSMTLLSGGPITVSAVSLNSSVQTKSLEDLPGTFETSKQIYTDVWGLGARTVQAACFDANTQRSTWDVTDQGVLIRGQKTAQSSLGVDASNYTLSFQTKPIKGGTGWRVASTLIGAGPYFVLTTSDYSQQSSISNSSFLPNTLLFSYGFDIVNATSVVSGLVMSFNLSSKFESGRWYNITTEISDQGYVVSIDNTEVATVSLDEAIQYGGPLFYPSDARTGTWGFGPYLDQAAYYRNVQVMAANGSIIYDNDMMSQRVLSEYGIHTNSLSVCLDGAKRDRLVWLGDFVHTARTLTKTTNRIDYITGTLDFAFQYQVQGLVPVSAPMGISPEYTSAYFPTYYELTDYQIFVMLTIGNYYRETGDALSLTPLWPSIADLVRAILSKIDPNSGLVAGLPTDFYFISGGQQNSTAVTGLLALALQRLAPVAAVLHDTTAANDYISTSTNLTQAINDRLWSDELGTYSISESDRANFSVTATAFAILSGAANQTQATQAISKLADLFLNIGYKDTSAAASTNTTQLSPFLQGFLLESLFDAHRLLNVSSDVVVPVIQNLLDTFWPHMLQNGLGKNEYYTGTSWEYLYPDGSPGIGLFTSHSHPWSSAPTYVLSENVLGVRPVEPGYTRWEFYPVLVQELGLTWAQGTVPTSLGVVNVRWDLASNGTLISNVTGPGGDDGGGD